MGNKYRAVFVSDVHIGMPYSHPYKLYQTLKNIECDYLYLNGDIFDGDWFNKSVTWQKEWTKLVKTVLKKAENGTKVYYLRGNHDSFVEPLDTVTLANIQILTETEYVFGDKTYLVTHGDVFDRYIPKWLYFLGGTAYWLVLKANDAYNKHRQKRGLPYDSIAQKIKQSAKFAVNYISNFESQLSKIAQAKNYTGIVCGHIHKPEIKKIGDVEYLNSGDWIDSCSFLTHSYDGEWKLNYYVDIDI